MQRSRKPRPFVASLVAGIAMLLPLAALAIHEIIAPSLILPSGEVDDAGQRSAGLFFLAAPFLYVVAVLLCFAAGQLFRRCGLRRLWQYVGVAALISLLIAAPVARAASHPEKFGWSDTLIAFLAIGSVLFACSALGAACWWWFAVQPTDFRGEHYT